MKKMIANVLVFSILTSSFGTFAATKSIAEIMDANRALKLSSEEIARKTTNDIIENKISQDEIMEYFESELPVTTVAAIKNAQTNDLTPAAIEGLMLELGKGAEFSPTFENALCLGGNSLKTLALFGGLIIAAGLYGEAKCNTGVDKCHAKKYDNPEAGAYWNLAKDQWERTHSDPNDPFYGDFTWMHPEPSYTLVPVGKNDPARASELRKYGAVALGASAVVSLSCMVKPKL